MRGAAVLLVFLLPLTLMPSTANGYEPGGGPTFNVPNPWGSSAENTRIVRKVEEAFRHVRRTAEDPHPIILVTGYLFDRKLSAATLINACRRCRRSAASRNAPRLRPSACSACLLVKTT